MNVFDYVNSISFNKKNLIEDDLSEKDYVPYIVNRSLSYFPDTILYAQEMNTKHELDKKLQYDYLLHSVSKRRRFSKWFKKEQNKSIQALADHYKISLSKAEEIQKVLTEEEIQRVIKHISNTGGY